MNDLLAKQVDAADLKSAALGCPGSSPGEVTKHYKHCRTYWDNGRIAVDLGIVLELDGRCHAGRFCQCLF